MLENLEVLEGNSVKLYRVLKDSQGAFKADPVTPSSAKVLSAEERGKKLFLIDKDWKSKLFMAQASFDALLEPLLAQSPQERNEAVHDLKTMLADLKNQETEPLVKAQAIMDSVSRTFLLNKASLKLKPQEVTVHEKTMARETEAIVSSALEMADDPTLVTGLFAAFQDLSNGQTVNHVMRVFASFTGFLRHYNSLHQHRLSQTLRKVFPAVYLESYRRLFPNLHARWMISDHLLQFPAMGFLQMREYALGALLHDIGKMGNLDYFESDSAYDAQQIRQHVFLSSGLILMNYGSEHGPARLLAGDHHNALGHPSGYGVSRLDKERTQRPQVETVRCLASDPDGFATGEALGYLPSEMLAVVDIYDAMIDTSRTYKKAMSPTEAVAFLEDTMVASNKLDPVLVDLYIDFLRKQGVELPDNRGFDYKTGGL